MAGRRSTLSQSIKTTESGGPRGYDAGKKVLGRKRQTLVDTDGRALVLDADLETVLGGFNVAYNGRRQRVLDGLSPEMVLRQRLEADPARANPTCRPPKPNLVRRALRIVEDAKEVSHPDTCAVAHQGDYVGGAPAALFATWRRVGQVLDLVVPDECANYLINSGYASV